MRLVTTLLAIGMLISTVFYVNCVRIGPKDSPSQENLDQQKHQSSVIFAAETHLFEAKVFYEPGAQPYTGALGVTGQQTWDVTERSYQELFQGRPGRLLKIPKTLSEMNSIEAQNQETWSYAQLKALGLELLPQWHVGDQVSVAVIFLNGQYYASEQVLGVHLTGTPYTFLFKERIQSVGGTSLEQKYIEQAVVVHELGHAVGLVDSGIPDTSGHEDPDHSHHTRNANGVMYWAVENSLNVKDFVGRITGVDNSLQLFGPESLDDAYQFQR